MTSSNWGAQLASVLLPHGDEVACLNCDVPLFAEWVEEVVLGNVVSHDVRSDAGVGTGGKHPNAPDYDRWAKEQGMPSASFAQSIVPEATSSTSQLPAWRRLNISVTALHMMQIAEFRPRLQHLWSTRKLVLGYGADPLRQRMDFADALTQLARSSPAFVPANCGPFGASAPFCGALLSDGLERSATEDELHAVLADSFDAELLRAHRFNASWNAAEQRQHVRALLAALKGQYSFYRQTCLAHKTSSQNCEVGSPSQLLGRVACADEDDSPSAGCVYAEVRRCGTNTCGSSSGFFEYARFHGPVQLFRTRADRHKVMGQCEEFSRAAYALMSALGYEARYVLDFTDHVWIEMKLLSEGGGSSDTEWVHADPSEGVLGNPLMYEQGWGKQLTMIFAMTPWRIEHVTERYTKNYTATEARRGIAEEPLRAMLEKVNRRLKFELPKRSWGHGWSTSRAKPSKDRSLEELALWSHFEGV
mmetsp:Transcript_51161/g.147653  ORF Transcript_51161/g.147653 Transcript_51161/m.147653 type:complete len:475 (-) Transcript_51161:197-1621(-)